MRRREFIGATSTVIAWPLAARSQQARKLPTIGFLGGTGDAVLEAPHMNETMGEVDLVPTIHGTMCYLA
jgi:hypothetical protein